MKGRVALEEVIGCQKEEPRQQEDYTAVKEIGHRKAKEIKLETRDKIIFREGDGAEWKEAVILSRAGKATGGNRGWYNIQLKEPDEKMSVNLKAVQWKRLATSEESCAVLLPKYQYDKNLCMEAKAVELKRLKQFYTYDEVLDVGQPVISTRWVMSRQDWLLGVSRRNLLYRLIAPLLAKVQ